MYKELNRDESSINADEERQQRFYEAWTYLSNHRIFNTTYGETVDLTKNPFRDYETNEVEEDKDYPVFTPRFDMALDIDVVLVNPTTIEIDEDPSKNTKVQIVLEAGPWEYYGIEDKRGLDPRIIALDEAFPDLFPKGHFTHDPNLDSRGDTFEDAIIDLAGKVKEHYDQLADDCPAE